MGDLHRLCCRSEHHTSMLLDERILKTNLKDDRALQSVSNTAHAACVPSWHSSVGRALAS